MAEAPAPTWCGDWLAFSGYGTTRGAFYRCGRCGAVVQVSGLVIGETLEVGPCIVTYPGYEG